MPERAALARATPEAVPAGQGAAWGAVSIVNATATGIGCSLAVEAATTASWAVGVDAPALGPLVDAVRHRLAALDTQRRLHGLQLHVECPFPPARGLKTSSSVAAAALRAGRAALGLAPDDGWVVANAVAAGRAAGVTLTGAFDDHVACMHGGTHLTDNRANRILADLTDHVPARGWHVAIWVPAAAIAKQDIADLDVSPIRRDVDAAIALARRGDLAGAMTANGAAYTRLYEAAGLPVTDAPAAVALERGARGAGLSGTGPAVAALFDAKTELPTVAGGSWLWTRTATQARSPP